ncbi:GNAT family N-acetyltransferase [Actinoplanes sp. TBRC 11911]|uniref:GNAT family N-acetyltransferase n=1 Tax=Actinoplanes sp. TBRC 11911 TaxID=2729386 RepID=UPI00145E31E1|nr:GNAT family N-acetyltransferase [Actinoplanes sp. TBRC 11911]NMO51831.1 GNAT family N-acetyltransferase [Actinoplanes sp. TBRC 11911]
MLSTERLTLRRFRRDDLDALAAIDADPDVMRYIMDGRPRTRDQTAESLHRMMRRWDEYGFGLFAVEVRETGVLAGWAGLAIPTFLPEVMPAVEIGWRLARPFWGFGYATEAATEAMRFAFETCGLPRLISIRHVDNVRSGRVMTKLGMRHTFDTVVPEHHQPVAVHELTREQYLARR